MVRWWCRCWMRTAQVVEIYGRKILTTCAPARPITCTCPVPIRASGTCQALKASEEIILCEALIDAMTFWVHGLSQRHGQLRHRWLHRRPSGRVQATRDRARADRLRPGRGRQPGRREAGEVVDCGTASTSSACCSPRAWMPTSTRSRCSRRRRAWAWRSARPSGWAAATHREVLVSREAGSRERPKRRRSPPASVTARCPASNRKRSMQADATSFLSRRTAGADHRHAAAGSTATRARQCGRARDHLPLGDRTYRVRGLARNLSYEQLKVNLLVSRGDDAQGSASVTGGRMPGATHVHIDSFDLYQSRATADLHQAGQRGAGRAGRSDQAQTWARCCWRWRSWQHKQMQRQLTPEKETLALMTRAAGGAGPAAIDPTC